jgi:hypothetical protein
MFFYFVTRPPVKDPTCTSNAKEANVPSVIAGMIQIYNEKHLQRPW